jgi:hypothetical protein
LNLESVLLFMVRFLIDGDWAKARLLIMSAIRTAIVGKARNIIIPFNGYKIAVSFNRIRR